MKERLVQLINSYPCMSTAEDNFLESISKDLADYLLANDVIVLPCAVGDDIYWINSETNEVECAKNDIKAVCYFGNGVFKIICHDENTPEDIGTKWCFLTKEEAEKALKEKQQ